MNYDWNFTSVCNNIDVLFKGLFVSFQLTLISSILGVFLALILLNFRTSKYIAVRNTTKIIIELFRSLPLLVLLVWLYYCLPIFVIPINLSPFNIAILSLTLNFAGYQSEIFRSSLESIPIAQKDVLQSMNFNKWQSLQFVLIPQTFYRSLSPLLGQVITTLKLSALASFITVPELFFQTSGLIQDTLRPLEFYTALAILYLLIIVPLSILLQFVENHFNKRFEY